MTNMTFDEVWRLLYANPEDERMATKKLEAIWDDLLGLTGDEREAFVRSAALMSDRADLDENQLGFLELVSSGDLWADGQG